MIDYYKEDKQDIIDIENFILKARKLGKGCELHDLAQEKSESIPQFGTPFTCYRAAYYEILESTKAKETRFVTIVLEVDVKKYVTEKDMETAITKGIYYGLDVKRVSIPADIKSITYKHL